MKTCFVSFGRVLSIYSLLFQIGGCAVVNEVNKTFDDALGITQAQSTRTQEEYDRAKSSLDAAAINRQMTWVEAARRLRDVDRSFAGRGNWVFNSYDEEYHAYCILAAEQVDLGKISYTYYDALRTSKFNDISARRQRR